MVPSSVTALGTGQRGGVGDTPGMDPEQVCLLVESPETLTTVRTVSAEA